jgi:pimeloyl-ACP methyl ester carboxylesterase
MFVKIFGSFSALLFLCFFSKFILLNRNLIRAKYTISQLGPSSFELHGRPYQRKDFSVLNTRGQLLECSHWEPAPSARPAASLPCLIYLHGSSASRLEVLDYLSLILPLNITVLAFDFAGCGLSAGDYISLGAFEKHDIALLFAYLIGTGTVSTFGTCSTSLF